MAQNNKDTNGVNFDDAFNDSNHSVQFDEGQRRDLSYNNRTPKIIQAMIKHSGGYIKDEKAATLIILGFVILFIIISMLLFFNATRSPSPSIPTDPGGFRSTF